MSEPKVLVCVLCGAERTNWINPLLFSQLLPLMRDPRFSITVKPAYAIGLGRVEVARNRCIHYAREAAADVLVQIDNDAVLPADFEDALHEAIVSGKDVVSFCSASVDPRGWHIKSLAPEDNGRWDGPFKETGTAGSHVLIISSEVWRRIPRGPWFKWEENDDEFLSASRSEDYYFSYLVRQHGLTLWSHRSVAGHLKTSDITLHENGERA